MRKTFRIVGFVLGGLLLLLVVAAVALPFVVDPNDFKPRIEAAVEEATGRQLEIPGDIDLTIFPWLGVELGAVRLGNAAGFGEEPFASIEGVSVRVKLLPLLAREIRIGKVILDEPVIRLQRNAEGVANWEDLSDRSADDPAQGDTGAPPDFSVSGLEINNATVLYDDKAAGLRAELSNFALESGELGLPADFPVEMSGQLLLSEPALSGRFAFKGRIAADTESQKFAVSDGTLEFEGEGDGLPVSPLAANLEWQRLAADLTTQTASVEALRANLLGLSLSATLDVARFQDAPRAAGKIEFRAEDITQLAQLAKEQLPPELRLQGPASGKTTFSYDQSAGTATLQETELQLLGAHAATELKAEGLPDAVVAEGRLDLDVDELQRISSAAGALLPQGIALSGPAKAGGRFSYNQPAGKGALEAFQLKAAGTTVDMSVTASGLPEAVKAEGTLAVTSEDIAVPLKQLGTLAPQDLAANGEGSVEAGFAYDQQAGTAIIPKFSTRALGVAAAGTLRASGLGDAPSYAGSISIEEFSPGKLLVKLGQELPVMRDGKALEKAALSATFDVKPNSAVVSDLRATLDQSRLTGRVEIADIEKQALRFDLALDAIDIDRYLPPAEEAQPTEAGPPLDQMEIPADLVRGHDIVGTMTIGKLKAFDFNSRDVKVGVRAQNDTLRIYPAEARLYGGSYSGDIRINASGKVPVLAINEHVKNVQLMPLVKDILEVENISGTAAIDIKAAARGNTVGAMKKTLDGNFSMAVKNGAIEGFNLWESIREAYAKLKGRRYDAGNAPNRTEFADLSATGRIEKGVLHNDDLSAKLPFLHVTGKGQIDIAKATMDYTIEASVLKSPELSGGIEELGGTSIPVRLTGPVMGPKVRPDVQGVLEAKAKEALRKKEKELEEEAKRKAEEEKKRLEDKLKDKLKDFLG